MDWSSALAGEELVSESVSYISPLMSLLAEQLSGFCPHSRQRERKMRSQLASNQQGAMTSEASGDMMGMGLDDPIGVVGGWDTSPSSSATTLLVSNC